jgi:hypothetical protein
VERHEKMPTGRFELLDARGILSLVTDAVHEDDAFCLALTCAIPFSNQYY